MKILSYTFELNPRSMLYPRLKGNKNFRHKQHFVSFFYLKAKNLSFRPDYLQFVPFLPLCRTPAR